MRRLEYPLVDYYYKGGKDSSVQEGVQKKRRLKCCFEGAEGESCEDLVVESTKKEERKTKNRKKRKETRTGQQT